MQRTKALSFHRRLLGRKCTEPVGVNWGRNLRDSADNPRAGAQKKKKNLFSANREFTTTWRESKHAKRVHKRRCSADVTMCLSLKARTNIRI